MHTGYLSGYFEGVAWKRLSTVEIDPGASNQHEFDGVTRLKRVFGEARQERIPAHFVYLGTDEDHVFSAEGFVTWYDARERHPTRSEYRMYFSANEVTEEACVEDFLVVGRRSDESVLVVIAAAESTFENQIRWLFGTGIPDFDFEVRGSGELDSTELDFATRLILEELGIEVETEDENWLDRIIARFGEKFPGTSVFSAFARETLPDVQPVSDADHALVSWIDREEMLFRTFERYLVERRLEQGFSDVDEFVSYSLSVLNRRKARAGWALEHHLSHIFTLNELMFSQGRETENRAKPDFLFPHIDCYKNSMFPAEMLTMLGVKSTCKDRWRQVLSEAARIDKKHLFTIEPGISVHQTAEMQSHNLQLVVPAKIISSYTPVQQDWLMNVSDFIGLVFQKQERIVNE